MWQEYEKLSSTDDIEEVVRLQTGSIKDLPFYLKGNGKH